MYLHPISLLFLPISFLPIAPLDLFSEPPLFTPLKVVRVSKTLTWGVSVLISRTCFSIDTDNVRLLDLWVCFCLQGGDNLNKSSKRDPPPRKFELRQFCIRGWTQRVLFCYRKSRLVWHEDFRSFVLLSPIEDFYLLFVFFCISYIIICILLSNVFVYYPESN